LSDAPPGALATAAAVKPKKQKQKHLPTDLQT
jgi:hypothetical protein